MGYPKQQVFDLLVLDLPKKKPKHLAEVVRYLPTEWDRERNGSLHRGLLFLVLLHAVLRLAPALLDDDVNWAGSYRFVTLVPFATFLFAYSLYRWQGQVFMWVGWVNVLGVFGLLNAVNVLVQDGAPAWPLAVQISSILIGAIALFLAYRVFPKFVMEKDPLGGSESVIFQEDRQR